MELSRPQRRMLEQVAKYKTALGHTHTRNSLYKLGLLTFTVMRGFELTDAGKVALKQSSVL